MKVVPKSDAKSSAGWLNPNETLTVLAVSSSGTEGSKYLIWSDSQDSVALFPASDFEIVDGTLSRRWIAGIDANRFVYLSPSEWQVEGFWENFHDGVTSAVRVFNEEMAEMLLE